MTNKEKEILEQLGWSVNSEYCIETWTDTAGQDLVIEWAKPQTLTEAVYQEYQNYNIDEQVRLYLNAKASGLKGVPTAEILVKDCQEANEKFKTLYEALKKLEA